MYSECWACGKSSTHEHYIHVYYIRISQCHTYFIVTYRPCTNKLKYIRDSRSSIIHRNASSSDLLFWHLLILHQSAYFYILYEYSRRGYINDIIIQIEGKQFDLILIVSKLYLYVINRCNIFLEIVLIYAIKKCAIVMLCKKNVNCFKLTRNDTFNLSTIISL